MQRLIKGSGVDRTEMSREKRPLERDGATDGMPDEKRQRTPLFSSVVFEALKMDSLQKICSSLEPMLRRVVGEEVERALAKLAPAKLGGRTSPKRIQGPDARSLRLQFKNKIALPVFTGSKVEGEQGLAIVVSLLDANTGQVVNTGTEAMAKLDVVVLEGDFANDDEEDWSQEEFEGHEVKEREGKRPLLSGELTVTLKEGIGSLGELTFTDNSSWIRSRKFRLGVKIASGFCEGIRIREAKTDSFTVKDHRGELYKKHYPPALHDEVWRLEKIGKDGAFHKRLNENGIKTVEDFLKLYVQNQASLKNILGSGMSNRMWESTVEHAKTCVLGGKFYIYYTDNTQTVGILFNKIYELMGLLNHGQYMAASTLSESQKVYVDKLVKIAYENWEGIVEYGGDALVSEKAYRLRGTSSPTENLATSQGLGGSMQQSSILTNQAVLASQPGNMQMATATALGPISTARGAVDSFKPEMSMRYGYQDWQSAESSQMDLGTSMNVGYNTLGQASLNAPQQNPRSSNEGKSGALTPPQSMAPNFGYHSIIPYSQSVTSNPSVEWTRSRGQEAYTSTGQVDDYFTEEDIRTRSMEMLEEDEMQRLLRMYNNTNAGQFSGTYSIQGDDTYPGYTESPISFGEERSQASGRGYVGWLKLKAALRWGIFIRKIAAEKAEKRAQLVELED